MFATTSGPRVASFRLDADSSSASSIARWWINSSGRRQLCVLCPSINKHGMRLAAGNRPRDQIRSAAPSLISGHMYVGKPLLRDEDLRLLRGRGRYTADIEMPNAAWAAFVRSPHARARVVGIEASAARAMPGVHAVLTAADWSAAGLGAPPCQFAVPSTDGTPMREVSRPVFASGEVRHVGDTVAAVIADTAMQAA